MPVRYGKTDMDTWEDSDLVVYADYSPFLFVVSDESEIPEPREQAVVLRRVGDLQGALPDYWTLFPFADDEFCFSVDDVYWSLQLGQFKERDAVGYRYVYDKTEIIVRAYDTTAATNQVILAGLVAMVSIALFAPEISLIGGLTSILGKVGNLLAGVADKAAAIRQIITNKVMAAKKVYATVAEAIHLDELIMLERIIDLTWGEYHEAKSRLLQRMGFLSEEIFGDIHAINQWLNLAGMVYKDWALLEGYTWEEQDVKWLVKSAEFLEGVEDRLEDYALHPELLWADMEEQLVRPIYEARANDMTITEEGRTQILNFIGSVQRNYQYLDERLREYQLALPDNIEETMGKGLVKFREDLRLYWNDNLKDVLDELTFVVSLDADRLTTVREAQRKNTAITTRNEMLLADPVKLSPVEAGEQREVHGKIQNSLAELLRAFTLEVNELVTPGYGKKLQEVWEVE